MSKLYEVYRKQVFELAATLVIKHSEVADRMNAALIEKGVKVLLEPGTTTHHLSEGFDSYDNNVTTQQDVFTADPYAPLEIDVTAYANNRSLANPVWLYGEPQRTWRYYLNLSGEYHVEDKKTLRQAQRQWLEDNYGEYANTALYREVLNDGSTRPVFDLDIIAGRMWTLAPRAVEVWNSGLNQWDEATTITLPTIFDKVFVSDRITAWEYRYGTVFHTDLTSRYPEFEFLINSILNPVDIDVAIRAENGSILRAGDYRRFMTTDGQKTWFDRSGLNTIFNNLIEENEISLIDELEDWVKGFLYRYHIKDYAMVDDLYLPSMLGVLYLQLPLTIMNIRLANCKTQKAHTYHISEYLESHGKLSKYVPFLNKKQALYLYRNVRYLEAHSGKQTTFKELLDNIMTAVGFSLLAYDAKHNNDGLKTVVMDLDDAETGTMPDVEMHRYPLNIEIAGTGAAVQSVRAVLNREINQALNNGFDLDTVEQQIVQRIATSSYDQLKTKVLESMAIDLSERLPFTISNVRVNYWIYAATMGLYKGKIYFTLPNTGKRTSLLAREALILFLYAYNKGHGNIELIDVPTVNARLIPRLRRNALLNPLGYPRPVGLPKAPVSRADFSDLVDLNYMPDDLLVKIVDSFIAESYLNTTYDFDVHVREIHAQLIRRYYLFAGQEHQQIRAYAEYAAMSMYWDEVACQILDTPTTYVDWLEEFAFDFTGMTDADYRKLADELLLNATGAGDNGSQHSLRELQEAAIGVMKQFSSYTVQYLQTTIDDSVYLAGPITQRVGDMVSAMSDTQRVLFNTPTAVDQTGYYHSSDDSHLAIVNRILLAWDEYYAYKQQFLIDHPNMIQVKKDKLLTDAFYEYFTEESIYGHQIGMDPSARMHSRAAFDVTAGISMRSVFNTRLKVNLSVGYIHDVTVSEESLLTVLPQFVLDGFLYPP